MQLYFIRHAQSENNLLWKRTGSSEGRSEDPELTTVGRRQAHLLAQYLRGPDPRFVAEGRDPLNVRGFGLTRLYTSLMVRSVATGTIVAREVGLPLVAWEDVHERGGIYRRNEGSDERIGLPGHNRTYFEEHYPDLVLPESLEEAGWWNRPYEEPDQSLARARRFLQELVDRHGHTEDRVAVISHGGFYNHVLAVLLQLPEPDRVWFALNNAAVTRIDFHDQNPWGVERTAILYTNRVDHLPKELIT